LLRPLIHQYQRDTLSILGLEAIEVEEDVISAPQILFPSHMVLPIGKGCMSPDLIALSRGFAAAIPASREYGARIYISRNDAQERRVDNEQDVMGLLGAYGFRLVRLSELSLAEQIALFRSAEAVVGPHGAGLVSTLYCRPGTKVIELWPLGFRHVSPFWNIASLAGLNYAMCICSAGLDARGQFDRRGMTVDLALLDAAIRAQDTRPSMDRTRSGPQQWLRGLRLFPTGTLRESFSRGKRGGGSIDGSSRRGRG
jgi:capsular polysaccharide biosynthesis protein